MRSTPKSILEWLTREPRHYQIAVLSGLLGHGFVRLDFEITALRAALILVSSLLVQFACSRKRMGYGFL